MEYLNAFWVGGLICALVQILLEKTTLLPGRIMVIRSYSCGSRSKSSRFWQIVSQAAGAMHAPMFILSRTPLSTIFPGVTPLIRT